MSDRRVQPDNRLDGRPEAPAAVRVDRVADEQMVAAAGLLVARRSPNRADAGRRFLEAARLHGVDTANMWASRSATGGLRLVCLAAEGSGGAWMLYTSPPAGRPEADELAAVIDTAARGVSDDGARPGLAQALLEPGDPNLEHAFRKAGFMRLADLAYLRLETAAHAPRDLSGHRRPPPQPAWPEGVRVEPWRAGDDPEFLRAIDRSYVETLDCPELCALRTTEQALQSHRATGAWDPALWFLVRLHGEPEGVMLLNPSPAQGHTELVYLGLSPALRGKGLGATLLRYGLACLAGRPERAVTCAVDLRNEPARRLYAAFGFQESARRIAMVRPLGAGAGAAAG